jgi:PAS domain S-box-containing protein
VPNEREPWFAQLVREATGAADEADTIVGAARRVLDATRLSTGWCAGHLCLPDGKDRRVFVSAGVWSIDVPGTFRRLREASAGLRFPLGAGLVGRAAQLAAPTWTTDVHADPSLVRRRGTALDGVTSACAFPIVSQGLVVAVLEFFASKPIEPDAEMLEVMAEVGHQLGRVADLQVAQRAVAHTAERLERLMDTSVEAFVSMNEAGVITAWNAAAERTFGLTRDEAVGRRLVDTIVPPAYRDAHHLGVGRFLTTGERHVLDKRFEITAWHPAGHEFPIELAIWAVPDGHNGWTFNGLIHDITERKRSQHALQEAYEHERAAVGMLRELDVAKREFAATVSHELRTPLANVIGYLEVLSTGDAGPINGHQARMLEVVHRNAERLRTLIEDLLTISRVEAGSFNLVLERTEVDGLLKQTYTAIEPRARLRSHRLSLIVHNEVGAADVDVEQLQRALINLLLNAVNYTPGGGEITLSARGYDDDVEIAVTDTGIGIEADEIPRLFDRFFRGTFAVREAVQGAGLGLAITKTIVEGHGGTIGVVSSPDAGSTFTVRLPRTRPTRIEPAEGQDAQEPRDGAAALR